MKLQSGTGLLQLCTLGVWLVSAVAAQQKPETEIVVEPDQATLVGEQAMVDEFEGVAEARTAAGAVAGDLIFSDSFMDGSDSDFEQEVSYYEPVDRRVLKRSGGSRSSYSSYSSKSYSGVYIGSGGYYNNYYDDYYCDYYYDEYCGTSTVEDIIGYVCVAIFICIVLCVAGYAKCKKKLQDKKNEAIERKHTIEFEKKCEADAEVQQAKQAEEWAQWEAQRQPGAIVPLQTGMDGPVANNGGGLLSPASAQAAMAGNVPYPQQPYAQPPIGQFNAMQPQPMQQQSNLHYGQIQPMQMQPMQPMQMQPMQPMQPMQMQPMQMQQMQMQPLQPIQVQPMQMQQQLYSVPPQDSEKQDLEQTNAATIEGAVSPLNNIEGEKI